MEHILTEAQRLHFFRPLDVHFARMLASPEEPALMLASACLSADTGAGHVCLPLSLLTPTRLFDGRAPSLAQQAWQRAGSPTQESWTRLLLASSAVSDGLRPTPIVLDHGRIYLQRIWRHECSVAHFFTKTRPQLGIDEERITESLLSS